MRILWACVRWAFARMICAISWHGPRLIICADTMYCADCGKKMGRTEE